MGILLGPVARVVSSPLRRAFDTAGALGTGLPIDVDERWIEVDYGEDEGRPIGEVPAERWARWRADLTFRPPGGESLAEVGRRVALACEVLFEQPGAGARDPAGDVVVVSHVSPIKAAVAWALQVEGTIAGHLHLSTGSVTRIGWGADRAVLHTYNALPPLSPELPA